MSAWGQFKCPHAAENHKWWIDHSTRHLRSRDVVKLAQPITRKSAQDKLSGW